MGAGIRLAVIGAGNMGQAIIRGVIAAGVMQPADVLAIDVDSARLAAVGALGCCISPKPAEARASAAIVLAVKPQSFTSLAAELGKLAAPTIVISVMAGPSTVVIRRALGEQARLVRVMPNTPAQIGAGVAAIALGAGARPGDETLAIEVFQALGQTVMVEERDMYAVTAVSGSGPAYVFLLAEAMERAGVELGLAPAAARLLVQQTIVGAGRLMQESRGEPAALRQAVTSPGGTTEAALRVMFERGLEGIIVDALKAARDRGRELDAP